MIGEAIWWREYNVYVITLLHLTYFDYTAVQLEYRQETIRFLTDDSRLSEMLISFLNIVDRIPINITCIVLLYCLDVTNMDIFKIIVQIMLARYTKHFSIMVEPKERCSAHKVKIFSVLFFIFFNYFTINNT